MVSIFGFKMQITPIAVSLIGIFFPFMFFGRDKLKHLAESMIGFGILFIGLEFIKNAVPNIQDNPELFMFLDQFTEYGFLSMLLFVGVGTLLTLLTQSSSAAMAITLVMLFQGWVNFPIAAAMILGENIGTTVTANIAAVIGNVHAKRAARFHFFFNIIGVFWMLLVINQFLVGIDYIMQYFTPGTGSVFDDSELARANATLALSLFHSAFNIINVLLLAGFVPLIIRMVEKLQKEKVDSDETFRLKYISSGILSSAELSITQAHKEIELFAKLIEKMHFSFAALFSEKRKMQDKFLKKIRKREEITDNIELEVAEYLTKISSFNLSTSATRRIRAMHSIINDLERVGDIYFQMSKTYETMREQELSLPPEAIKEIEEMLDLVLNCIRLVRENMKSYNGDIDLEKAIEIEKEINEKRDLLKSAHYSRLEKGDYHAKAGVMFLDFLSRLEKIGDHLFNVNEALAGKKIKAAYSKIVEG